jgi:uncharacterized protein YfaS (alpha-2-macroglobulin family)
LQLLPSALILLSVVVLFLAGAATSGAEENFSVSGFTPQGLVRGPANIRVDFSSPVIASDDIGSSPGKSGMPVLFSPPITGRGIWISRSSFMYQLPDGYLPEATEFTATIPDQMKDFTGKLITGTKVFRFNTEPLKFLGIRQTDYRAGQNVSYELNFNGPVDYYSLKTLLRITASPNAPVKFGIENTTPTNSVKIYAAAEDGSPLTVEIPPGLKSARGSLSMTESIKTTVSRDLSLKVTGAYIDRSSSYYDSDDSTRYIWITTTTEVDTYKTGDFIEITPKRDVNITANGSEMIITGDFPPRELITVKLKAGLPATQGDGLSADWEKAFIFPDYEPFLDFAASGRFISPTNEALIVPFAAININKLHVTIGRVYDNNVTFLMREGWPYYYSNLTENIYDKDFDISSEPNKRSEFSIDLKKILNGRTGLFTISASNGNSWPSTQRIINVTDLAGSAKIGDRDALIWVNSISSGAPVQNVAVELYSNSNQIVGSGATDSHGAASIKRESRWDANLYPSFAVLKKDGDVSILHLTGNIWQTGNIEYTGASYERGKYTGFVYTPRGIFRPGETVPVQLMLRKTDLSTETPFPVQVKVFNPTGREWNTSTVTLSEYGAASIEVPLAYAGPTGTWGVSVFIPGETSPIASGSFIVEDFAPPKLELFVSSDQAELRSGSEPQLDISARYLFGAAGAGLEYEVERTLIPGEYSHRDWQGYAFSDYRVEFTRRSDVQATGTLSPNGDASVKLEQLTYDAQSMLNATFRVGVREDGGRWVYKSISRPYYPRDIMLGIKHAGEWSVATNTNIPFSFAAVTTDGKPADGGEDSELNVKLTVSREISRTIMTTSNGERRSESRRDLKPLDGYDKKPIAFKNGVASEDLTFLSSGYYSVVIEDEANETSAATRFYVYDTRWDYSDGDDTLPESLSVKLDKESYRVGEQARATVSGSFEGTVLFSVETDNIHLYDTAATKEKSAEFSFTVTENMTPNAWVTAHLVRAAATEDSWTAHRAFGAAPVLVDCRDMKLGVEIISPEKIRPNEANEFKVKLTDDKGNGSRGEVSVMLVDEGVLGLTNFKTPNFYEHYMRKRALTLYAYDIYTELMPLYLKAPQVLTAGGGDESDGMQETLKASISPVRADRFKILTVVKTVLTDDDGNASFSLDVPEFSGKARLMAVASAKKAFGSGERSQTVARDVVTDIALPRALAPKDTFESQIQLFNRTDASVDVAVSIDISGPISIISAGSENDISPAGKHLSRVLTLPAQEGAHNIPLRMKADDESGVAEITLETSHKGASHKQRIEMAVRPPYPRVTASGGLTIKPGVTSDLELPVNWFPGTRRAIVSMSGIPSIGMTDMAKFLLDYPYWCLEQTVSRGWALLNTPDLAAQIDKKLATREHLQGELSRVIRSIQSMQLYNGAFSTWQYGSRSQWTSIYATHFLLACEKEGVDVPRETLRNALEYVRYLISDAPSPGSANIYGAELSSRAYAAYVLAQKGEAPLAWMSYLRNNLTSMPEYGRILLAMAYAVDGDKKTAISIVGEESPSIVRGDGVERLNFDSPIRTGALRLLAWCEIDPSSANAATIASQLLASFRSTSWYTTQEAGWTIHALSKFYAFNNAGGKAKLTMSAKSPADAIPPVSISGDESLHTRYAEDVKTLSIQNDGDAAGYVTWSADGVPTEPPAPETSGMSVSVRYYDENGYEITDGAIVKGGSKVKGTIFIQSLGNSVENVVVSLPMAGGLEIENPKLTNAQGEATENDYDSNGYNTARTEIRDDRLILIVDHVYDKFKWTFTMRAITPGTFVMPPIAAEGMYSPGIRSVGSTSSITVK